MMTDVSFVSKFDGTEQKYVLFLPESFEPGVVHDVLIALHGAGSDRWQFATQEGNEFQAARDIAAEHSLIYVSPDYRGPSWMGPTAEADVVQIISELKAVYRVSRVLLCGSSMGGACSLAFAVLHPELIDGVASTNGLANFLEYENYQDAMQESYGSGKAEIPLEYKNRSAEYWPEKLTMPIGMTASGKDTTVPPDSVLRLAKVLETIGHPSVKLLYRPDMGHERSYADAKAILEFILEKSGCRPRRPGS